MIHRSDWVRIEYVSGNENAPDDPFGRCTLVVESSGRVRLENVFVGRRRAWEGRVDAATRARLSDTLRRSGFPAVPQYTPVAGTALRWLSVTSAATTDSAVLPWFEAAGWSGYDELFVVLDGLTNKISGGAFPIGSAETLAGRGRGRLPLWRLIPPRRRLVGAMKGDPSPGRRQPRRCLQRLQVGGSRVLDEIRRAGVPASDHWKSIDAVTIDPTTFTPLDMARKYPVAGRPALWYTPDRRAVVVDADLFSSLKVGDATRLRPGQRVTIGRMATNLVAEVPPRDLVAFLLHMDIVQTYWHLKAELCLKRERRWGGYRATFSGVHYYATGALPGGGMQPKMERLRFALRLGNNGVIELRRPVLW